MNDFSYEWVQKKLANERVLLIGGAGFIGHNLALELRRIDVDTMVLDNLMINSLIDNVFVADQHQMQRVLYQNFLMDRFRMMREAGIKLHNADARNMMDLARTFDEFQPTKVVHLSAIASAVEARAPAPTFRCPTPPGASFPLSPDPPLLRHKGSPVRGAAACAGHPTTCPKGGSPTGSIHDVRQRLASVAARLGLTKSAQAAKFCRPPHPGPI